MEERRREEDFEYLWVWFDVNDVADGPAGKCSAGELNVNARKEKTI